ncbi:MAG: Ig-like domain-containing protein [Myxococcota bacterium]|nr:Ig-like domain-containing protein [Myxococcota bacterium]
MTRAARGLLLSTASLLGAISCADPQLDPAPRIIHARFDPDAKAIPMPNDAVRDAVAGVLDLPNDEPAEIARLTAAEQEFYAYLETLDGWSSLMSGTVELTGAIDPRSIDATNLQVWRWTGTPTPIEDVRISIADDGKQITIDPPRTGWARGERYVVLLRGGALGARGAAGERVECDAAFYFLRQTTRLDTPEHERAFPGDTRDERMANAKQLEDIRVDLAPMFDFFERRAIPRADVAALWAFTVTTRTELAMDKASQRMPLPINLMLDPRTGHVHVPAAPWDRPFEAAAKSRLSEFTGFGLSASPLFEFTAPMNPTTVTASTVKVYRLGSGAPVAVPADITLMPDRMHVIVTPQDQRFAESTSYVVVVDEGVRDAAGQQVMAMPAGHFLKAQTPVFVDGATQVKAVDAVDAEKLELGRVQIGTALEQLGRARVLAAWPFTTMPVKQPLAAWRGAAERLAMSPEPVITSRQTPGQAVADFPLGVGSLTNLAEVYHGTIASPFFLDPRTTALRGDGEHVVENVAFTLTVPRAPRAGPMPVVIFGHGLVTERRFVLAVAGQLAGKGFASIAIDFPYHGTRTYCAKGGPVSVINPTTGTPASLEPCAGGSTCNELGRCVDASGLGNQLAKWPILDLPIASGAVFTDVNHIASTKDHFLQALVDLGALDRALRKGDWAPLLGRAVDTSRIYYTGQSLGGIMGALFLGTSPDISRAVLNVPGADLIRMFDESTFFSSHLDGLFLREGVAKEGFDGRRLLEVARWIMDAVDPQHLGPETGARALLIQMATLDFIIPNDSTKELQQVTGAPRRDYLAEHGFLTIPVEPEYFRGVNDLAKWLAGEGL